MKSPKYDNRMRKIDLLKKQEIEIVRDRGEFYKRKDTRDINSGRKRETVKGRKKKNVVP